MGIKEREKKYGLVGKNIGYSFSRHYFSSKFEKEGLSDCSYINFDLPKIQAFEKILSKKPYPAGLNVTIPYKKNIMPFLDKISEEAKSIGAVNTIVWDINGKTTGHNTDHIGFHKSLLEHLDQNPRHALILGSGGASSAVKHVLNQLNCKFTIISRSPINNQLHYDELNKKIMGEIDLIVNTTPLGTFPNIEEDPPIPYEFITNQHFIFDLIYNPEETSLMKKGKVKGARVTNGYKMLMYQAEKAWDLWNQ
jgi:shikimate dehydrogenase